MGKTKVETVRLVEIDWDGRGYTDESWKRDRKLAEHKLKGAKRLFFTMPAGENKLIIATAPVDRLIIDEVTEEDLDQEWMEYPSIDAFVKENQDLFPEVES